ncbi:MAG: FxDxF family PEP-CTERM protein [Paraglaciecola sp.]|uniref:FxDxF family PEP-CTERM protein n=1 Tax=Paraglaciecola sp. TaxID=1920173 RepID=UPI00329864CB
MKIFKKIIATLSLVALSAFANAETFDLGDVTGESVFGISNDVYSSFSDEATFTLTSSSLFESVLFNISFATFGAISDFELLISGAGTNLLFTSTDIVDTFSFGLTAGDYTMSATGNAFGPSTYDFTVSPVPEASTIALMLSGLGFVGFMARRGRKQL